MSTAHNYTHWIVGNLDSFEWNNVAYDGHGYVILNDGTRIDTTPDTYKKEREKWNVEQAKQHEGRR